MSDIGSWLNIYEISDLDNKELVVTGVTLLDRMWLDHIYEENEAKSKKKSEKDRNGRRNN